jgi:hypothetical protein
MNAPFVEAIRTIQRLQHAAQLGANDLTIPAAMNADYNAQVQAYSHAMEAIHDACNPGSPFDPALYEALDPLETSITDTVATTDIMAQILNSDERVMTALLQIVRDDSDSSAVDWLESWLAESAGIATETYPEEEHGRLLLWTLARITAAHLDYRALVRELSRQEE